LGTVAWSATGGRGQLLAGRVLRVVLGALVAALVGTLLLIPAGVRPLVVQSGSMSPTIETGDVIFTEMVHPYEAAVGDIVTFSDPSRSGRLVTHRVLEVEDLGTALVFVTRGDANTGVERWGIGADERVGKYLFRLPKAGFVASWGGSPAVRFALLAFAAIVVSGSLLWRIWR
jgi:signal peptidase